MPNVKSHVHPTSHGYGEFSQRDEITTQIDDGHHEFSTNSFAQDNKAV
jgi:hypothetical protein